jgi:uncharacterized protein (DUF1778 family)
VAAEYRRAVQAIEQRQRRDLGERRYEQLREVLERIVAPEEHEVA